jgi:hypothetical protein
VFGCKHRSSQTTPYQNSGHQPIPHFWWNCIQGNFYNATVSKMATKKIDKLLMVSDFNDNWYLGVLWSEVRFYRRPFASDLFFVRICYQPYLIYMPSFVEIPSAVSDISEVKDFEICSRFPWQQRPFWNDNWYLGVLWSEVLVGNDETCINMPEFWYGGRLGTSVFASKYNQT